MAERILVVEDDEFIREIIAASLQDEAYVVEGVGCASEVWQYLESATPDLVLLDLALPQEDGLSICRKLRALGQTASVPIVFVSAMGQPMYVQAASHAGGNAFIRKPFEIDHLIATVRRFIGTSSDRPAEAHPIAQPL